MKKTNQWACLYIKNMKYNQCKLFFLCCIFFLNAAVVFSQDATNFDLRIPSLNLDMDAYIQEETSTWLSLINRFGNNEQRFDLYGSLYTRIAFQKDESDEIDWNNSILDLNFYFPIKIRINNYFSVPIYGSYFGTDIRSKRNQDYYLQETNPNGLLFGGGTGLIFTSKFGALAGLAGFKLQMSNRVESNDDSNISPAVYLVPIINTSDYPLLGVVFESLSGYLGLNENKISNYSVSLISQTIDFSFMKIGSIDIYHNSLKYNFDAEAKNYGLRLNIFSPSSRFGFGIDAGYRSFFNVANNDTNYKDGWFTKLIYITSAPGVRSSLYVSFDTSYYPLPKFGVEGNFNLLGLQVAVFMELGFPRDCFEFTLGERIYIDYGKFTQKNNRME
jgi:hypothetical protein